MSTHTYVAKLCKIQKIIAKHLEFAGLRSFFFWSPVLVPPFLGAQIHFLLFGGGSLKNKTRPRGDFFFSQGAGHVLLVGAPKKRVSGKTQKRIAKHTELLQFCFFSIFLVPLFVVDKYFFLLLFFGGEVPFNKKKQKLIKQNLASFFVLGARDFSFPEAVVRELLSALSSRELTLSQLRASELLFFSGAPGGN